MKLFDRLLGRPQLVDNHGFLAPLIEHHHATARRLPPAEAEAIKAALKARLAVVPPWVADSGDLTEHQVEVLALALHERRHGDHVPVYGTRHCAELAGCFDDVRAIAPEIRRLARGELR